ncbi:MAG: SWIM zinc finger family protein, partial [Gammaproteobacteria bacterium]
MLRQLNQYSISRACGEAAARRGRDYFEMGKVLEVEIRQTTDNLLVHGTVSGSNGSVYKQAIAIAGLGNKHLAIHGLCSCP